MTTEDRLAALEAEVRALKAQLGGARSPSALEQPQAPRQSLRTAPLPAPPPLTPPILHRQTSAEVRLGSYWVTRIGAILVLLAAIFLAAYLSIYSSAPIRVSELAASAMAALGVAYWQQHRGNLRFALVLHSLGDALVFFTAFAAYAFDATRVIDGIPLAIAVQTAAGGFVCAHALQRRAEGSATFSLVLLAWVAGFSLTYQHSGTTLGYVAAITLTAAILRVRWGWNWPLLFAAVAGPVISGWLADDFAVLRGPLQLTWALLPLIVAAPAALGRAAITRRDRGVVLTASGMAIGLALWARYSPQPPFPHQLLIEAGALVGIAGLYCVRRQRVGDNALHLSTGADAIRGGLIVQHLFLAAFAAALYLLVRFPDALFTGLGILGLGLLTAGALRTHTRWVAGFAFAAFAVLAVIWRAQLPAGEIEFGSRWYWTGLAELVVSAAILALALGREGQPVQFAVAASVAAASLGVFVGPFASTGAALFTLIGVAVVAAAGSPRIVSLRAWAGVALAFAHCLVLRQATGVGCDWQSLVLLTAVDAALLGWARLLCLANVRTTLLVGAMLATLFFGFAEADLPWSVTFVWVPLAAGTFMLGFWRHNANYRLAALAAFGVCLIRLFARDLNTSTTRIAASFLLGIILLGIGYLYSRLNRKERREQTADPIG